MSRQSLTKAHAKMTELWWEPIFASPAARFGTHYTFEKAPKKDPPKQIIRLCFPMEEQKDNRVYGAIRGTAMPPRPAHRSRRTRGDLTSDAGPYPL